MKKWEQPKAEVQLFVANEYVAACWSVSCSIPYEEKYATGISGKGYDPFKLNDMNNLHQAAHCGAEDAFELELDEAGNPVKLWHVKAGSTNNQHDLECKIYTDSSYKVLRDIRSVSLGETIYFTTVNGRTWHHHGTVQQNHS